MSAYTATAARALATITRKGASVTFVGALPGEPATYDEATDTWSGGTAASDVTGKAVQIDGDPDKLASLGLALTQSVTLLIAASGLAIRPVPNMALTWGAQAYTIVTSDPTAPDGTAILYTVVAKAG